jgi:pimeloyl-ACP methyl ester carboxylesterase
MSTAVPIAMHTWPPDAPSAPGGPRRTAVLVHGVTGWHRTWWRVGPALAARGWTVVAVDQRGHGRSPRIDGWVTVGDLAADLAAVLEAVEPPVDAVIGHSLGAAVSAELAFGRPDLLRRLVLEDPPAVTRADDFVWQGRLAAEMRAARETPASEIAREHAEHPRWLDEDVHQNVEGRALADEPGLVATYRRDTGARVLEIAPLLRVPALYVLGDEAAGSVLVGAERRRLEASLPANARLAVLDAGHTTHRDRFDEFLAAVVAWIEVAS